MIDACQCARTTWVWMQGCWILVKLRCPPPNSLTFADDKPLSQLQSDGCLYSTLLASGYRLVSIIKKNRLRRNFLFQLYTLFEFELETSQKTSLLRFLQVFPSTLWARSPLKFLWLWIQKFNNGSTAFDPIWIRHHCVLPLGSIDFTMNTCRLEIYFMHFFIIYGTFVAAKSLIDNYGQIKNSITLKLNMVGC